MIAFFADNPIELGSGAEILPQLVTKFHLENEPQRGKCTLSYRQQSCSLPSGYR